MSEKRNFNNSTGKVKYHGYKHIGIRIKVIDLSPGFIIYQLYELGAHFSVFLYVTHSQNENFDYYAISFFFPALMLIIFSSYQLQYLTLDAVHIIISHAIHYRQLFGNI